MSTTNWMQLAKQLTESAIVASQIVDASRKIEDAVRRIAIHGLQIDPGLQNELVRFADRWAQELGARMPHPASFRLGVDIRDFHVMKSLLPTTSEEVAQSIATWGKITSLGIDNQYLLERLKPAFEAQTLIRPLLDSRTFEDLQELSVTFDRHMRLLENIRLADIPVGVVEIPTVEQAASTALVGTLTEVEDADEVVELSAQTLQDLHRSALDYCDDDLSRVLSNLDPSLADMLRGARLALQTNNPDRARHCMSSYRELLRESLGHLAPDERVLEWLRTEEIPRDRPESGGRAGPTRRERILYLTRRIRHGDLAGFVEQDFQHLTKVYEYLCKGTHVKPGKINDDELNFIAMRAEIALVTLFKLRDLNSRYP